jgi:hypothetical protein
MESACLPIPQVASKSISPIRQGHIEATMGRFTTVPQNYLPRPLIRLTRVQIVPSDNQMSTLQEQVQREFDAFFLGHPRLKKSQRNVDVLCSYLQRNKYPFPYTSSVLAEAFGQTKEILDFIPLPPPPAPQPQKQEEAPPAVPAAHYHCRNGFPTNIQIPEHSPAGERTAAFARAGQQMLNNYADQVRQSGRRN